MDALVDYGQWVLTDWGWTFASDDPWSSATHGWVRMDSSITASDSSFASNPNGAMPADWSAYVADTYVRPGICAARDIVAEPGSLGVREPHPPLQLGLQDTVFGS